MDRRALGWSQAPAKRGAIAYAASCFELPGRGPKRPVHWRPVSGRGRFTARREARRWCSNARGGAQAASLDESARAIWVPCVGTRPVDDMCALTAQLDLLAQSRSSCVPPRQLPPFRAVIGPLLRATPDARGWAGVTAFA